jgi:hypothetical protein
MFLMSQQMTSHEASGANETLTASSSSADGSSDRLLSIIKCMKREKDVLVGKVSILPFTYLGRIRSQDP